MTGTFGDATWVVKRDLVWIEIDFGATDNPNAIKKWREFALWQLEHDVFPEGKGQGDLYMCRGAFAPDKAQLILEWIHNETSSNS